MPRNVVFVGIFGCSGSGKTSVASQLASQLHSPFFAISLDRYYDDSKVQQYKTAEHFHTLRVDQCYNDLAHLKSKLNSIQINDTHTLTQCLHNDTSLSTQLRSAIRVVRSVAQQPQQKETFLLQQMQQYQQHVPFYSSVNKVHQNESSDKTVDSANDDIDQSEDESLKAHEQQDYNVRQHYSTFSNSDNNSTMKQDNPEGHDVMRQLYKERMNEKLDTIYVICEGFVLFCVPAIQQYCNVFDVFVQMSCEADTMCYRRFCRTPRRSHVSNTAKVSNNVAAPATATSTKTSVLNVQTLQ